MSIFEIAIAPHRNAMRARYKDHPKKSTNAVGMITALHSLELTHHTSASGPSIYGLS